VIQCSNDYRCLFDRKRGLFISEKLEFPAFPNQGWEVVGNMLIVRNRCDTIHLYNIQTGQKIYDGYRRRSFIGCSKVLLIEGNTFVAEYYGRCDSYEVSSTFSFELFNIKIGERINQNIIQADRSKTMVRGDIAGNTFIIAYEDGNINLFDKETGELSNTIQANSEKQIVKCDIVKNTLIVACKGGGIYLFDKKTKKLIKTIQANSDRQIVTCDIVGDIFIVAYEDGKIDLFDKETGKLMHTFQGYPDRRIGRCGIDIASNTFTVEYQGGEICRFNIVF